MSLGRNGRRWFAAALFGLATLVLGGCATAERPDPIEGYNRKIFAFNEAVDDAVLKPVATGYNKVVPSPVRTAVGNFFGNLKDGWSAVNLMLQGRFIDGMNSLMRVGTNTLFGFFGIADIATDLGIERQSEDFGQTLGTWGFGPGAYIVWPILGPSTLRDSIGLPVDLTVSPETLADKLSTRTAMTTLKLVNTRASLLGATDVIDGIALDKYTFIRDAYLQRRRSLVYNGNAPSTEERFDLPEGETAPAPATKASEAPAK